jgi:putative FmdB family regulatory protein
MPIYEYQCAACGRVVEKFQKVSDPPLTDCPACGGSLHKIISSCAFHLKGSGWYVTDYAGNRSASTKPPGDTSSGTDDSKKSKDTDKSEKSAPASKIK